MEDEARAYVAYLSRFDGRTKPVMPKFDIFAYTDNEYIFAINKIMQEFENISDEHLTLKYLKGE